VLSIIVLLPVDSSAFNNEIPLLNFQSSEHAPIFT